MPWCVCEAENPFRADISWNVPYHASQLDRPHAPIHCDREERKKTRKHLLAVAASDVQNEFVPFAVTEHGGIGPRREDFVDSLVSLSPDPCLLYTSPSPRDQRGSRMPSSA